VSYRRYTNKVNLGTNILLGMTGPPVLGSFFRLQLAVRQESAAGGAEGGTEGEEWLGVEVVDD
jgi:hypothetical protein